jgi:TetR/AcrR family transcriptional repressor of nem operon
MPYSAEHRARTRTRIIEAARRLFNRHGFEQVTIDQVMADAGLTRGGFYHHFPSKDALYAAAVSSYARCNPLALKQAAARTPITDPQKLAHMLVNLYLSDGILEDTDLHCPLYALASDVSRAGNAPRQAYTDLIRGLTHVFRCALAPARDAERRAQTMVSLCVGGMVLARTTNDDALRRSLRSAARQQALALLEA